jgi:hypothetical protein
VTDRYVVLALVYPAPLYAAGVALATLGGSAAVAAAAFVAVAAFGTVVALGGIDDATLLAVGRGGVLISLLGTVVVGIRFGSAWFAPAAGLLLGVPFLWLDRLAREGASPAGRVLALQLTFLVGLIALVAAGSPSLAGGRTGAEGFLRACGEVVLLQLRGLTSLLAGHATSALPLAARYDPVFVALAALAMLGWLVDALAIRTGRGESLPWAPPHLVGAPSDADLPPELATLRPGQLAALASRTRPEIPYGVVPAGFGALVAAAAALGLLVVVAGIAGPYAVAGLVVGAAVATGAVVAVLSRRLKPVGDLAG